MNKKELYATLEELRTGQITSNMAMEQILLLFSVVGRSEEFVCLCPRNETDNCDRKEPCKECKTCPHFKQTNCQ